jgi:hypothetical protein
VEERFRAVLHVRDSVALTLADLRESETELNLDHETSCGFMMTRNNAPIALIKAAAERKVLPFLGAGFSKNISTDMPSWRQLIERAAGRLKYDASILQAQADQYQIAEYLHLKNELSSFYRELDDALHDGRHRVQDSRVHEALCRLDAEFVFTTNWDNWIEKAFDYYHFPYQKINDVDHLINPVVGPPKVSPTASKRKFMSTTIVKFHGDFDDPASLVFRETDYHNRLDFRNPLDIKLQAEAIRHSVLFIGYSFTDKNTRYIWHRLRQEREAVGKSRRPASFFVTFSDNTLQRELFAAMDIETIVLDPDDSANNLEALFEELLKAQRS